MFTSLPDFTPRDPHSLWYTSSRNPGPPQKDIDRLNALDVIPSDGQQLQAQRMFAQKLIEQTSLARLAVDEQYAHRRRLNISNFGSGWLKPPGIPKTLYQMREEQREAAEHAEAMRREQMQQELQEQAQGEEMPPEEGMDDVQLDGAQDLDDEIPEADDDYGMSDEEEEDEEETESEEEEEQEQDENGVDETEEDRGQEREEHQNDLMAAMIRSHNDAFREALIRGDPDGDDMYGANEELEQEDQGQMLDEEDFTGQDMSAANMDDEMGVDLDDEIPDAESLGGYEHTDSEAELSSDEQGSEEEGEGENRSEGGGSEEADEEDDDDEIGFAPRTAMLEPPMSPTLRGRTRAEGPRPSMDISGLLSQDESSFMDSSPAQGRWQRQG